MAGLCEDGNEPSGSLKAVMENKLKLTKRASEGNRLIKHVKCENRVPIFTFGKFCIVNKKMVILRRFINSLGYLASEWDEGDNSGEMSPGTSTESYPAFAHVGLRDNPGKNLNQLFSTFCVNVKMQYTLNQRLFLVKQYWITNSITATQRAYQREFDVRNLPKRNTILGLVNKLETTGSLTFVFEFVEQLDDVELSQGYFQQDGATCHTLNESMELIASFFDDRIISRNLWPPRSPDLTTPDFFLWGYLKDRVYATRPQTLDDLKHNITQEIQANNRVLQRVASNMERRVELCLMQDGGHFQHLL
ncbi:hypothetical protein ANN_13630 [Periplaneta americana]|uniref:DUF4817 domain-containing protein n=1 Tax=Periplaneta americana TaxID=6978 RepID=A0ABQ8TM12_PERAM|nr:hypothetical protein ANN_13630 [Periplaneta americana]